MAWPEFPLLAPCCHLLGIWSSSGHTPQSQEPGPDWLSLLRVCSYPVTYDQGTEVICQLSQHATVNLCWEHWQ